MSCLMFFPLYLSESYKIKRPNCYKLVGKEHIISGHKPECQLQQKLRGEEEKEERK